MANHYRTQYARLLICGLLVLALGLAPGASAQPASPEFEIDVVNARESTTDALTRVDVYTKIPYARLQFINTTRGFVGRYEVTAAFYELDDRNRPQNLVQTHVWDRTVPVNAFAATQSDQLFDFATQSLALAPGRYLLELQITDQETQEAFVRKLPVEVRNLNKPVSVSDLILVEAYDVDKNAITPRVASRVGTDESRLRFFHEFYARQPTRVRVTREVLLMGKESGLPSMRSIFGLGRDEGGGDVVYTKEEATPLKAGQTQTIVEIPIGDLKAGEYLVRVQVEDEQGRLLDAAEKSITVHWTGLAEHIRDLDQAIAQLQYIAKDRDLRYIRGGQTEMERLARFQEFWKKRDPTPGTDRNERMEEYYYRIAYANRQYGSLTEGWKTDQGHVLVLFGEPDFVERHPYNFDVKPYEIWYYERIGRRFIFIDETGLGDYKLHVPIWDERTRIR